MNDLTLDELRWLEEGMSDDIENFKMADIANDIRDKLRLMILELEAVDSSIAL